MTLNRTVVAREDDLPGADHGPQPERRGAVAITCTTRGVGVGHRAAVRVWLSPSRCELTSVGAAPLTVSAAVVQLYISPAAERLRQRSRFPSR